MLPNGPNNPNNPNNPNDPNDPTPDLLEKHVHQRWATTTRPTKVPEPRFVKRLRLMMYAHGDSNEALDGSAAVIFGEIENFVVKAMHFALNSPFIVCLSKLPLRHLHSYCTRDSPTMSTCTTPFPSLCCSKERRSSRRRCQNRCATKQPGC